MAQTSTKDVAHEFYWTPEGLPLTVCVLVYSDGTYVVGDTACTKLGDFDLAISNKVARFNAMRNRLEQPRSKPVNCTKLKK